MQGLRLINAWLTIIGIAIATLAACHTGPVATGLAPIGTVTEASPYPMPQSSTQPSTPHSTASPSPTPSPAATMTFKPTPTRTSTALPTAVPTFVRPVGALPVRIHREAAAAQVWEWIKAAPRSRILRADYVLAWDLFGAEVLDEFPHRSFERRDGDYGLTAGLLDPAEVLIAVVAQVPDHQHALEYFDPTDRPFDPESIRARPVVQHQVLHVFRAISGEYLGVPERLTDTLAAPIPVKWATPEPTMGPPATSPSPTARTTPEPTMTSRATPPSLTASATRDSAPTSHPTVQPDQMLKAKPMQPGEVVAALADTYRYHPYVAGAWWEYDGRHLKNGEFWSRYTRKVRVLSTYRVGKDQMLAEVEESLNGQYDGEAISASAVEWVVLFPGGLFVHTRQTLEPTPNNFILRFDEMGLLAFLTPSVEPPEALLPSDWSGSTWWRPYEGDTDGPLGTTYQCLCFIAQGGQREQLQWLCPDLGRVHFKYAAGFSQHWHEGIETLIAYYVPHWHTVP